MRAGPPLKWSLHRRLARVLATAVVLPVLLLAVVGLWYEGSRSRALLGERMTLVAQSTAREIDEFVAVHLAAVVVMAERRTQSGSVDDVAQWRADMAGLRRHYPGFTGLLVADRTGTVVAVASDVQPVGTGALVADREYFRVPRDSRRAHVSGGFRGRATGGQPLIAVSAPLYDRDGRFAGVAEGSIRSQTFAELRADELYRRGYEVLLLDDEYRVIYTSRGLPYQMLQQLQGAERARWEQPALQNRVLLLRGVLREDGNARATVALLRPGWRLALLVPQELTQAEGRRQLAVLCGLLLLAIVGAVLVVWRQGRTFATSLNGLLERMQRLALDSVPEPLDPTTMPRELAPLAESLNHMAARLGAAYRRVTAGLAEERRLAASLEHTLAEREQVIAERTMALSAAVAELDRLNRTDPLTGCLNVRGLREALTEHDDAQTSPLAVLAIDVDLFKGYNDHYGHPAGDVALCRVVGAIRSALRGTEDVLARAGGEEFIVLLPEAGREVADSVAERIRQQVHAADIAHLAAPQGRVTVSIGIAVGEPAESTIALLNRADQALYRAKRDGRDRACH